MGDWTYSTSQGESFKHKSHGKENKLLTISEMAKGLGVSRKQVSSIINQRSGISPEMAVRLSEAIGTSVELWTNLQSRYDAYQAHKKVSREGIKRFYPETQA
jgi:antitoxin HigA-1